MLTHMNVKKTAEKIRERKHDAIKGNSDYKPEKMYAVAFNVYNNHKNTIHYSGGAGNVIIEDRNLRENIPEYESYKYAEARNPNIQKFPWGDRTLKENRHFLNCAEAKAWMHIVSIGEYPKNWAIVAFNDSSNLAGPCKNCELWVNECFKAVFGPNHYRSDSKQGIPRHGSHQPKVVITPFPKPNPNH